jgi:tetratricopeptide (TPR) repeat protein
MFACMGLILFLSTGCGKEELQKLRSENEALKTEKETLKAQIASLKQEISKLKETADYHYQRGVELLKGNKYEEAKSVFEAIVEKYPDSSLINPAKQQLETVNREIKGLEVKKLAEEERRQEQKKYPHIQISDIRDFIDNTEKYKGKAITLVLKITSGIFLSNGKSLRDYVGSDVQFLASGPKGATLRIVISIPNSLSVPKAEYLDMVRVTFVCEKGDLMNGNRAFSIERP